MQLGFVFHLRDRFDSEGGIVEGPLKTFNKRIQAIKAKGLVNLVLMGAIAVPTLTVSFFTAQRAIAQSTRKAVVFDSYHSPSS